MEVTVVPASFDLPTFVEVVRGKDGFQNFGRMLAMSEVGESDLTAYEADLLLVEAHVAKEISRARKLLRLERSRREVAA